MPAAQLGLTVTRARNGAESASPASGPAITSKSERTSAMVRAMGDTPIQEKAPALGGKCPCRRNAAGRGLPIPQIPQIARARERSRRRRCQLRPPSILRQSRPLHRRSSRPRECAKFQGLLVFRRVGCRFIAPSKIRECWYFRGGWRLRLSIARQAERPDGDMSLGAENRQGGPTGDVNAVLMVSGTPWRGPAARRARQTLRHARLPAGALAPDGQPIQFRMQRLDALKMAIDDFDGRNVLGSNSCAISAKVQ